MPQFDLNNYVDVQTRISRFWNENPAGAIRTNLASPEADFEKCRYRAEIYKDASSAYPDAVGYAFEVAGGRGPNSTSHEENCETSAIGRALANMGYATNGKDRPSRQEMTKVQGGDTSARTQSRDVAPQRAERSQPAQGMGGPPLASEKQMGAIYAISMSLNMSDDDRSDLYDSTIGVKNIGTKNAPNISSADASKIIEALNARKGVGQ